MNNSLVRPVHPCDIICSPIILKHLYKMQIADTDITIIYVERFSTLLHKSQANEKASVKQAPLYTLYTMLSIIT